MSKRKFVAVFGVILLNASAGCAKHTDRHVIRIDVPSRHLASAALASSFIAPGSPLAIRMPAAPASLTDFDCVNLNITGDGIPAFGPGLATQTESNSYCTYGGLLTPPISFAVGGVIEALVPAGAARRFQALGWKGTCTSPTPGDFQSGTAPSLPDQYIIGDKVSDVFDDISLDIPVSYDSNNTKAFFSCFGFPAGGGGGGPVANPRIFVTAAAVSPNFGGGGGGGMLAMAAADAVCQSDANNPGDGGTYMALLAGTARVACTSANCTTGGASENIGWVLSPSRTYYRADGTTIVGSTTPGGVFTALSNAIGGSTSVMTGLANDWTSSSNNCSDWNSTAGYFETGDATSTTSTVMDNGSNLPCTGTAPLICVEQ